ncbi:MAG: hypothetical protein M3O55_03585 [Actinomycetota bacterium]|nr:hypothetical protein [Actinomycetota bacterium]
MRRLFWAALGAVVGILIVRKLTSTARAFTPAALTDQLSQSVSGLADSVRDFAADIKDAMAEREEELMAALADDGTGRPPPGGNAR